MLLAWPSPVHRQPDRRACHSNACCCKAPSCCVIVKFRWCSQAAKAAWSTRPVRSPPKWGDCVHVFVVQRGKLAVVAYAGVRPVPLEIHIMAFDIVSFDARLQAMARPTYSGLVQASSQVTLLAHLRVSMVAPEHDMHCSDGRAPSTV